MQLDSPGQPRGARNDGSIRRRARAKSAGRSGLAATEAAVVLPFVVLLLMGMWEVGAMVKAQTIMTGAAREGCRMAAGGTSSGTTVTVAMVQQIVRDYMTTAGLPSAAVSGATITLTNLSTNTWTDPGNAIPLDRFRVTVTVPSGAAYNSLMINSLNRVTGTTQITVQQDWLSANDAQITVSATLPY